MGSSESNSVALRKNRIGIVGVGENQLHAEISEAEIFQHGFDGLRLWEAGIVLARYITLHHTLFDQKDVLELGCGVGLSAIPLRERTRAAKIVLSDYNERVLANAQANVNANRLKDVQIKQIDWKQYQILPPESVDLVIGSDIVYFGCPVQELYALLKRVLRPNGIAIIVIPDRKNYADLFLDLVEKPLFTVTKETCA